jgi:hypothetical protein
VPESTASGPLPTTPLADELSDRLREHMTDLLARVAEFGRQSPTPATTYAFEKK